jgi:hypothetical protein
MSKDEWREKITNRLTPMDLFKLTPKTNCGECGFPTCLAFATQSIVAQADIGSCPYLDPQALQPFRRQLEEQHQSGIGVKREGFDKALEYLRGELQKCDFEKVSSSIGASCRTHGGKAQLDVEYFGRRVIATKESIQDAAGEELNPWEKIFLYNYILGGATEPSGTWVGMESLPNSVSKIKTLRGHCENRLAARFGANLDQLSAVLTGLGTEVTMEQADLAVDFQVLPKLAIRVLWWAEDPAEGFESRVKFLFDSKVLQVLDLESLLFACEQLTERLLLEAGTGIS